LRSRSAASVALLEKEYRELMTARAWWVLLVVMGPLVGVSFISAVRTYAEASGLNGTTAGVGEAFSPLVGIWAPRPSARASWRRRSCCRLSRFVSCLAIAKAAH
jgi:hypothetical protein